jgi:hypothetical protein
MTAGEIAAEFNLAKSTLFGHFGVLGCGSLISLITYSYFVWKADPNRGQGLNSPAMK